MGVKPTIKNAYTKWWPLEITDYVIIEDVDEQLIKHLSPMGVKTLLDCYPIDAEYKGGNNLISPRMIVLTSNMPLESLFTQYSEE